MTRKFGSMVLIFCVAGAALSVAAQQAAVAPQAGVSGTAPPDDAAGGRSLRELRKDMRKAEDRFNALYNKLNPDRDQHVICGDSADTGTRLAKRSCTTQGARSAATQDAIDYMMAAANRGATVTGPSGNTSPGPMDFAVGAATAGVAPNDKEIAAGRSSPDGDARREGYRDLEKLLAEHPDLRRAAENYVEARRRYAAAGGK